MIRFPGKADALRALALDLCRFTFDRFSALSNDAFDKGKEVMFDGFGMTFI